MEREPAATLPASDVFFFDDGAFATLGDPLQLRGRAPDCGRSCCLICLSRPIPELQAREDWGPLPIPWQERQGSEAAAMEAHAG
eukprot:6158522-Pyramimonas_sp.AAC.1